MSLAALTSFALLALGCPEESTDPPGIGCKLEYIGDKDAPIELEVITLDPEYASQPLAGGGDASILYPPQGGRVIFVGVRAKNLDPCSVKLAGTLRDPATEQIRIDTRIVNLDPTADGFGESDPTDITTFSNIPVCPNNWAMSDVFDQTFSLEMGVRDRNGKEAGVVLDVVPRCDETQIVDGQDLQKTCLCICKQGYVTGEMCQ